ncbi:hypothetical protein ACWDBO_29855 [Streptomyces mirabilis]|uniref:hypothetical protein n=1 Tax=Streptomyces mirabilis TaxID=68239 RepID=UPI00332EC476
MLEGWNPREGIGTRSWGLWSTRLCTTEPQRSFIVVVRNALECCLPDSGEQRRGRVVRHPLRALLQLASCGPAAGAQQPCQGALVDAYRPNSLRPRQCWNAGRSLLLEGGAAAEPSPQGGCVGLEQRVTVALPGCLCPQEGTP